MKLFLAAAALFFVSLSARASDTFQRTLSAGSEPDLYVSTGSGRIHVYPGSGSQIHIVGHVHAERNGWGSSADGDVDARIQRIVANPPIAQSGNSIHVGEPRDRSLYNHIAIDYDITVPGSVALNLHSGSGDLQVDNVGRFLAATSGSGSVRAHQLHGPAELHTGSGDIELEETGGGDVKAQTGSGSVRVHGFAGTFNARTGSGDIEGEGHLTGMSTLTSGSGSVRLHLSPDSHFHLEAATGSGDIRVHMPAAGEVDDSRHHLSTAVNGGGPPVSIHTGSGDIEISSR
jgi:hypothetical protein